jgi:hypothetical protein
MTPADLRDLLLGLGALGLSGGCYWFLKRLSKQWVSAQEYRYKKSGNRQGFGVSAIERLLGREIDGQVKLEFDPKGLRCSINAPRHHRTQ